VLFLRVAIAFDRTQRREVLELQLAEIVGFLRVGIFLRLDDRRRSADAGRDVVREPVGAAAVMQRAAVGRELGDDSSCGVRVTCVSRPLATSRMNTSPLRMNAPRVCVRP
jgi:hypothetical protein